MTDAPFEPYPGDVPPPGARPRAVRRPWEAAIRCPSTARRARPEDAAELERFEGFAALHAAISAGPELDAVRLWAGGVGAAAVTALLTVLGWLIVQGVLGVPVPAPAEAGPTSVLTGLGYALCAAAVCLQATAVLHLLSELTARPIRAFCWIFSALIMVATLLPFALDAPLDSRLATSAVDFAVGVVMLALLASTAALSQRWPDPGASRPGW